MSIDNVLVILLRLSSSGRTTVSKIVGGGSIPSRCVTIIATVMFLLGYKARGIKTSFNGEGEIGISKVIYI